LRFRFLPRGPVECRQHTGERASESFDSVGNYRQSERRETNGITIRVQNELVALGCHPRDDTLKDRSASNCSHRLVATSHTPRQTTGEKDAHGRGLIVRHCLRL
jgi:hypothetical protein